MEKVLQLTAIIEREGEGYVATCPEVDIVSQGNTVEEARLNLLEAVEGFFEVASPSEIRRRLKKQTYIMPIMPTVPLKVRQAVSQTIRFTSHAL
jgi:predicted RNase H-like HicB family nuclease